MSHHPRVSLLPLALILARPPGAPAQETATTPPPARLEPARLAPYHQTYRMVMVRDGQEQPVGALTDELIPGEEDGAPVFIRVQHISTGRGVMTDTAVASRATLAPRWHSSHGPNRVLRLAFAPTRVTGSETPTGGPPAPIDQPVGEHVFDSNMLDVLLASLPLAEGYAATLAVYLYEAGGTIPVSVAVTGSEVVDGREAWRLDVTVTGRTAQYYVAKQQPHVIRIVSSPSPGIELRFLARPEASP